MHSGISFMLDSPTALRTKSQMSENLRHSRTYEHWPRTSITVIGNANPRSPTNQNLLRLIPRLSRPPPPPLRRPIARIPNPVPPPRRLREPPHCPTKSLTVTVVGLFFPFSFPLGDLSLLGLSGLTCLFSFFRLPCSQSASRHSFPFPAFLSLTPSIFSICIWTRINMRRAML